MITGDFTSELAERNRSIFEHCWSYRSKSLWNLIASLSILMTAGCSSSEPTWAAWATQIETGKQGWETFGPTFNSRDDCIHAFGYQVSHARYLIKRPFDCVYTNDNLVMMVLVNELYNVRGLKCVARFYHPDPTEYDIVLSEEPNNENVDWRCIWKF